MTGDPDLDQALIDLAPVAAELRATERRWADEAPNADLAVRAEMRDRLTELRDRIKVRAERIVIEPGGLMLLLDEAGRLRKQLRRKPPREMLERAVSDAVAAAERREASAHVALTDAQVEVRNATRARHAAADAMRAYAGRARA